MLNRVAVPIFGKIESIGLQEPEVVHLDNGIPVFCINAGIQNVVKVELAFPSGTSSASKMLVASASANLLTEGTSKHTAAELAEAVDFYGAYLQTSVNQDETSLNLFSMNKHLSKTLKTLTEVYQDPIYPETELATYIQRGQHDLLINTEKVGYLASKAFSTALFGEDHPYGRSANIEDYNSLSQADLKHHYNKFLNNRVGHIIVAGKLLDDTVALLNENFGQLERVEFEPIEIPMGNSASEPVFVPKKDAVQNAIRIGRVLFKRSHPDFIGMQILSTILGGYFGSRLMANIREDKGYTYGVGAGLVSLKNTGYLSISTEVGSDVCKTALSEIYLEIEKLRKNLVSIDELELVRNYMLGTILKSVDGAFSLASKWNTYLRHGLSIADHENLIHQIKTITPEHLRTLANKYLQREDLIEVVAGT